MLVLSSRFAFYVPIFALFLLMGSQALKCMWGRFTCWRFTGLFVTREKKKN